MTARKEKKKSQCFKEEDGDVDTFTRPLRDVPSYVCSDYDIPEPSADSKNET